VSLLLLPTCQLLWIDFCGIGFGYQRRKDLDRLPRRWDRPIRRRVHRSETQLVGHRLVTTAYGSTYRGQGCAVCRGRDAVQCVEDAMRAVEMGVNAIYLSNHG